MSGVSSTCGEHNESIVDEVGTREGRGRQGGRVACTDRACLARRHACSRMMDDQRGLSTAGHAGEGCTLCMEQPRGPDGAVEETRMLLDVGCQNPYR